RQVMDRLYDPTERGYPGDEDQGQTSSWFVLSALGFYPVTPGSGEYVLGSPLFEKATIHLDNGKKFTIRARGNTKNNVYIQAARLNGQAHTKNSLHHGQIAQGGELLLEMGDRPNKDRGTAESDRPSSVSPPNSKTLGGTSK